VRRLIPASVAAFGFLLLAFPVAHAQLATSASSSHSESSAASGRATGYSGANQSFNHSNCCTNPATVSSKPSQWGSQHPHHYPFPAVGAVYAVPYPVYLTDPGDADSAGDDSAEQQPDPADSAPGPTIFDRRGSSQPSSVAEAAYDERMRQAQREEPTPQSTDVLPEPPPVAERPPTILVFKDGHQLEVQNYAIVGNLLFDMTPGRRNKIAVADLDLTATAKQNDDRGIDFQLPGQPATKAN
jgi:hypothetical protein